MSLVLGLLLAAIAALHVLPAHADTPGLGVTMDDAGAVIQPGDDIVYTVQAVNSSSAITAASVGLTLTTPVGVTFDQCAIQAPFTGACSGLAGGASISLNETLAPTTTATITVRVKTSYSVASNLVAGVVLGARDAVSPTTMLQAGPVTVETDVLLPALQLTLDDGLVSTIPGAEVTYQVTAANAGAAPARTVQMTFTLPAHTTLVAVSGGGALQTPGGATVAWPAFDVPANDHALRTVTVRVDNPVAAGATTLTAQAQAVHIATPAGSVVTANDSTAIVATGLSTRVWRDLDGNGVLNGSESGLAGVRVRIAPAAGQPYTRTTDTAGVATLIGIPAGPYTVTLDGTTLPANFLKTAESDATLDGVIGVTTAPGPAASIAFGFAAPAAIADSRLILDVNGNGQRDAGEPGVAGVTVTRRSAGRDNQFDTADDAVLSAVTDASGAYAFAGLTPGRHRITIDTATTPPGYGFVQEVDQSTDGVTIVTLVDSQVATGLDFFFAALDLTVQKTDESVNPTTGALVPYRITYANPSTVAAQ
ncbi:MAG: DUF11 domain-containing protein, partial [Caldilineaceae bacterium]|nr:DUF11 domain-containing protein [Caldilineaceae bacterium]